MNLIHFEKLLLNMMNTSKSNVTSHTHFRCSLTHPLVKKKQLKHLWEEIFWLDDIFLNKLQIKQGHWNTIFSTSTFQLHFCIVHTKQNNTISQLEILDLSSKPANSIPKTFFLLSYLTLVTLFAWSLRLATETF